MFQPLLGKLHFNASTLNWLNLHEGPGVDINWLRQTNQAHLFAVDDILVWLSQGRNRQVPSGKGFVLCPLSNDFRHQGKCVHVMKLTHMLTSMMWLYDWETCAQEYLRPKAGIAKSPCKGKSVSLNLPTNRYSIIIRLYAIKEPLHTLVRWLTKVKRLNNKRKTFILDLLVSASLPPLLLSPYRHRNVRPSRVLQDSTSSMLQT